LKKRFPRLEVKLGHLVEGGLFRRVPRGWNFPPPCGSVPLTRHLYEIGNWREVAEPGEELGNLRSVNFRRRGEAIELLLESFLLGGWDRSGGNSAIFLEKIPEYGG
jgi:hypothetical protein